MSEEQDVLDIIGSIYDAALDPALWTDVLIAIKGFVGGQACALFTKNSISKCGTAHYYSGGDPYYAHLYTETYSKFGPLANLPVPGQVVGIPDLVCYDEHRKGRFYREWLQPQGYLDVGNVVLKNSGPSSTLFAVLPGEQRMVDDDLRRRMALLVPHLKRALVIEKTIDLRQTEATGFADALDGLSTAVFLLDRGGGLVYVNAAGKTMLAGHDFLRTSGGRLIARNAQINQTLRRVCSGGSDVETGLQAIALPLDGYDSDRYIAHLLPLMSGARRSIGADFKATAALFVRNAVFESRSGAELIARTYHLTPTELRVLLAIVDIGGVPETAEALGIAETTVKTHLHRVFSKTNANRQADLVKLVAGFSSPLKR